MRASTQSCSPVLGVATDAAADSPVLRFLPLHPLLLPIPHARHLCFAHLPLKLEDGVNQGLGSGRTSGNINVDGNQTVNAPDDRVAVMVIPAAVCTAPHADDPFGVGHLVVAWFALAA